VSGQLHAPAALPPGKSPRYPFYRRLGGPQSRSGRYGEVKIFYPTGTETPPPPGLPTVASGDTDWASPAHFFSFLRSNIRLRTLTYKSFFTSIRQIHEQSYMMYKASMLDFAHDPRIFIFCVGYSVTLWVARYNERSIVNCTVFGKKRWWTDYGTIPEFSGESRKKHGTRQFGYLVFRPRF
jgi:hypothetical protein